MLAAVHIINLLPSPSIHNHSPHYLLYQTSPTYTHLKTIGCLCFPWLKPYSHGKLSPRSVPCIFLGYAQFHKGYKCYDPATQHIYISRHVRFCESTFPFHSTTLTQPLPASPQAPPHPITFLPSPTSSSHQPSQQTEPPLTPLPNSTADPSSPPNTPLPSSNRDHHPNPPPTNQPSPLPPQPQTRHHPMLTRSCTGHSTPKVIFDLSHSLTNPPTPTTYSQAAKLPQWQQAMTEELQALLSQHTWELVPPPPHQPIVGCRWTYKTKLNSDGTIARHKARLVAQGYTQTPGLDYNETFSPVAKFPTIRILLTVATVHKWPILQLDVSNAFLHGTLSETIYMSQPPGFKDSHYPNHVCLLKKSLYGLKQSPRQWYHIFSSTLQSLGFTFSTADPSLMIHHQNNIQTYILIYVDDILLTGNNQTHLTNLISTLHTHFQLKNLGEISTFLGIQTIRTPNKLFLHQSAYTHELLNRADPMQTNIQSITTQNSPH